MTLSTDDVRDMVLLGKKVPDAWLLIHQDLPFTVNAARSMHHHQLAKKVKTWREAGWACSLQAKVPKMKSAEIHVVSLLKRMNRDLVAEALAYKGFLDGAIIDAGVMPDDRPPYVRFVGFHEPIRNSRNGMAIIIHRCA